MAIELQSALERMKTVLDGKLSDRQKPGNRETDLAPLVVAIASVLLKHHIVPKKTGNEFRSIVGLIFDSINEPLNSVEAAVQRAWTTKAYQNDLKTWYAETIQELVDRYYEQGSQLLDD